MGQIPQAHFSWRSRVRAVGMFAVAAIWTWRTPSAWIGGLCALLGLLAIASFFLPRLYRPVDRSLLAIETFFLRAFSWIVLALVFVLVFLPGRFFFASRGRRRIFCSQKADTYWQPASSSSNFDRQF